MSAQSSSSADLIGVGSTQRAVVANTRSTRQDASTASPPVDRARATTPPAGAKPPEGGKAHEQWILDYLKAKPYANRQDIYRAYTGVGSTTIRAAINRLLSKKLITMHRQKGWNNSEHLALTEPADQRHPHQVALMALAKKTYVVRTIDGAKKLGISKAEIEAAMQALCECGEGVTCAVTTATTTETEFRLSGFLPALTAFRIKNSDDDE